MYFPFQKNSVWWLLFQLVTRFWPALRKRGFFGLYYNSKLYYIKEVNFLKLYNQWISLFKILFEHFFTIVFRSGHFIRTKKSWNHTKNIGLVRVRIHGKLPIIYFFGLWLFVQVWILSEPRSIPKVSKIFYVY